MSSIPHHFNRTKSWLMSHEGILYVEPNPSLLGCFPMTKAPPHFLNGKVIIIILSMHTDFNVFEKRTYTHLQGTLCNFRELFHQRICLSYLLPSHQKETLFFRFEKNYIPFDTLLPKKDISTGWTNIPQKSLTLFIFNFIEKQFHKRVFKIHK